MRLFILLFLVATTLCQGAVPIWSKTGHRVTGEVANQYLTRKARKAIDKLLNGQSLAAVSTFGDDIKADRKYREFSPWHYVNFPADKKYTDVEPSEQGDVVMGIQKCIAVVKDKNSSLEDKRFYLKFLVHLMGDLHQPMHVGRKEDKGGNDIQLQWFGRGTNLHRVWDSNMINDYGMGYRELASNLPRLSKEEVKQIQQGNVLTWVEESQELANKVYDSAAVGEKLGYRYSYDWWPTVEQQLQRGGIRLAAVLNDMFK
ncbi:S1/P1 nuclease [Maribacter sp. 2307ULW6-5]|uniref:S1/P1 nuclease n=1 Tax=Maribacter sp. 2307ULW6-5 TaxID=3386275 RepID=UPI0039BD3783